MQAAQPAAVAANWMVWPAMPRSVCELRPAAAQTTIQPVGRSAGAGPS
jgi:hypothetical protein